MIARYLFAGHLGMALRVLAFVVLALFLGQFADSFQFFRGNDNGSALTLLWRALLRTPAMVQYALPHVMIIATILFLHRLGVQRELAIMAGVGRHAQQLLLPLAASGLLLGTLYVVVVGPAASYALEEVDRLEEQVLRLRNGTRSRSIAVRQDGGTQYVFARAVTVDGARIEGVTVIEVTEQHELRRRLDIDSARRQSDGTWQIEGYTQTVGAGSPRPAEPPIALPFDAGLLLRDLPDRRTASVYELRDSSDFADTIAAESIPYRFQFYWLVTMPLFLSAVCFVTGAATLQLAFNQSWGRRALEVVGLAFPVYVVTTVVDALSVRGFLPPLPTSLAVPVLLFAIGSAVARLRGI